MIDTKVKIDLSRYDWAIGRSDVDEGVIRSKFPKLTDWVSGVDQPTMKELSDFSLTTHVPIGYFFLDSPPRELDRSVKSLFRQPQSLPSRNLLDTSIRMLNLQDWMGYYHVTGGDTGNGFFQSLKITAPFGDMANEIRDGLGIGIDWFANQPDTQSNFDFIRSKMQHLGITVMTGGVVGSDATRPLDINEFRAFTMVDHYAPLIFINDNDTPTARIFCLIHELVCVGIGINDLFHGNVDNDFALRNHMEITLPVTAEILLPIGLFNSLWHANKSANILKTVSVLAKYFKVSEFAIARRALEGQYVSEDEYNQIAHKTLPKVSDESVNDATDGERNAVDTFLYQFD
ncbi:MAG: ImmA/IrrE family metallo-endopeptidase, partial [Deltaproteobacteria bacterium]|nr:ImmA/IrrE family metallo-endopeptidase [Deltaproteobacteria bacterium]